VNFSARTVISPDPLLSINEVGVPYMAARELTVPVHVNEHNIEKLKKMVARGPAPPMKDGYLPGVNYVIRPDGRRIRVTERNAEEVAENIGIDYTIERQLVDGDVVLFNRQPSLHRMSMMAHRVKMMEGKTFRFNLCDCPPYNADFDGDEMNLHVLQSDEARAEARILMQVQENILSPRYGGPIIGAIHDHITGAYFLTHNNPKFDRTEAMNILSKLRDIKVPEPSVDKDGKEHWTGKQLFSTVLPEDFRTTFKSNICQNCDVCLRENCHSDAYVKIRNGQLLCGTIDAKGIGNSKGKILDRIARDYGAERAAKFINEVTRLALGALMNHGFSTGIGDEDIPEEAALQIVNHNQECINKVFDLVESYQNGTLEQMPGRSLRETLEVRVMKVLSEARDEAGRVAGKHLGLMNPAVIMAKTGARGSMLNLSQMAGCVGQQAVRGERLSRGYWNRTLPHFHKGDLGAQARGFCSNSYKSGLNPTEFFFHAMGGREGLVDTAVRTSRSGYMQRRLISALEDLKLTSDGTVRNTVGTIIQFKYGEDGVDPSRTVRGKAIDIDDLFSEVLGDEADILLRIDERDVGEDYGSREKDEMEYTEEEDGEEYDDIETDFEGGGE
jgi:DNA-directed RNA polymerase subunit A'